MALHFSIEPQIAAYEASPARSVVAGERRLAACAQKEVAVGAWQPTYLAPETRPVAGLGDWWGLRSALLQQTSAQTSRSGRGDVHTLLFDHLPDLGQDSRRWRLLWGLGAARKRRLPLSLQVHRGNSEFPRPSDVGLGLLFLLVHLALAVRAVVRLILRASPVCHVVVIGITDGRARRRREGEGTSVDGKGSWRWWGRRSPLPACPVRFLRSHIRFSTTEIDVKGGCRV